MVFIPYLGYDVFASAAKSDSLLCPAYIIGKMAEILHRAT